MYILEELHVAHDEFFPVHKHNVQFLFGQFLGFSERVVEYLWKEDGIQLVNTYKYEKYCSATLFNPLTTFLYYKIPMEEE